MKGLIRDITILVALPVLLGCASALCAYVALRSSGPRYACDTITTLERDPEHGHQVIQTQNGMYLMAPGGVDLGDAICRRVGE